MRKKSAQKRGLVLKMNIYIIRHGETDWNVVKRLQGHSDIPLNEEGIRLARVTSEAMKDIPFSVIYTSPLKRAKETATLIRGERDIPIIEDERIKEICFGIYEGLHCAKERYDIPDREFMNFFECPEKYQPPENGETIQHLCDRTTNFLQELIHNQELENKNVLISTHGAAIRGILSLLWADRNANKGDWQKDFWKGGVHKNCAVTLLESNNGKVSLIEEGKIFYE